MKRSVSLAALLAYVLPLGCSSVREVPVSDTSSGEKVYSVILLSGEYVEFDDNGGIINSYRGTIDGRDRHERPVSIKLDNVKSVRADRTNTTQTVAWTIVGVGACAGLIVAVLAATGFGW